MEASNRTGSVAYLVLLTMVAALGGLLFGYDTAVISGAIGFLGERFALDAVAKGWAASCVLVGCIVGAAFAGALSDRYGRKKIMLVSAVLFAVSALTAAIPRTLAGFVWARFLGGVGVGMASMLSPMYISEVAPARARGALVSVNQLAIIFGMLVVYFVNAWIAGLGDQQWNVQYGWRWMFASGLLPAVLFLGLLCFVPESPRWLVEHGREDVARRILERIGGARHAEREVLEVRDVMRCEPADWAMLLSPGIRRALVIGVVLAVLQQVTGINTVLYYAPEIFKQAGATTTRALNDTVIVGIVNLVFTVVAIAVVDLLGRKPLLLIASAGMGASLAALGVAFLRGWTGVPVLVPVLTYVASFAVAMGPVVWVVMAEIFPTRIRGRAMSLATVCLWVACFAVSQTFLWLLENLKGNAFFLYAGLCAVAFFFVLACVPETRGKSLEQIERDWLGTRPAGPRGA